MRNSHQSGMLGPINYELIGIVIGHLAMPIKEGCESWHLYLPTSSIIHTTLPPPVANPPLAILVCAAAAIQPMTIQ